jgi:signal transduction histidine kinase
MGWWRTRGFLVRDSAVAVALAVLAFVPVLSTNGVQLGELDRRPLDALAVVLALGQCLPLAARTRWPAACLAVVVGCFCADQVLGYPPTFGSIGIVVALYSVGAHQTWWRRGIAATATGGYAMLAVVLYVRGAPERPVDYVTFYLVLAACWGAGSWVRARRLGEAERQRLSAELAVATERARIARELHDVVTHHVTAMVVQADAAQFLLERVDRIADTLTAVSGTGRRALAELRYLLDVLERPAESSDEGATPAAGRIHDLVEQTRSTGQPVELAEEGTWPPSADGVQLAAYRVVQEGLTNALRHAPGSRTCVRIRYGDEDVDVEVITDAPSATAAPVTGSGGRGLAGLRERVGAVGGELVAGERADGGFSVRARLPVRSGG